ncbi:MAG: hypothetical protein ACJ8FZ_20500 [Bradyrhizobium sp.]
MKYSLLASAAAVAILGLGLTSSADARVTANGISPNRVTANGISPNRVTANGISPNRVAAKRAKVTRSQILTDPTIEVVGIKLPRS